MRLNTEAKPQHSMVQTPKKSNGFLDKTRRKKTAKTGTKLNPSSVCHASNN